MDMVPLPHTVSRSHGPAMLGVMADSALVGVLLVLGGLLGHLASAAGVQAASAASSLELNHTAYRYDGLHRRSLATQLRPAAAVATPQSPDAVVRRTVEPLLASETRPAPAPLLQSRSLEGRSLLDDLALGTRVRPAAGARAATRAAATTTALAPRKKQRKEDDDDDGGGFFDSDDDYDEEDNKDSKQAGTKTFKIKKHKLKKWLLPLLVGYKLKFMTLVPLLFATLALLVASAGFAGFFFAMFTAALTLGKSSGHH